MFYKTILVHLNEVRRAEAALEPAVRLAARHNSHLIGLHVQASVPVLDHLNLMRRVTNLANARYAETSSFNAQQGERFRPGTPRQLFVGARYRFGQ